MTVAVHRELLIYIQIGDKMANIYKVGDRLGNNEILFKEVAYITSYGHRYGVFECPICH